jgi:hypothetical protein
MRIDEPQISDELRAPFPWFGGKRRVAELVWSRLGDVATYNEPFAGSLAVLLGRPHDPRVETVNDLDCYIANFWRALQYDPDAVAFYADAPVNEADLHSRHRWLVGRGRRRVLRCARDPHFFDAKIAGWWVWGQCLWIGSGWCQSIATHRRTEQSNKRPKLRERGTDGVARHQFDRNPKGTVHQKRRPHLTGDQAAMSFRRWQGGGQGGGSGVHAPRLTENIVNWSVRPDLSADGGRGLIGASDGLFDYLRELAIRLRRVRVCCGDWKRVLTPSVTTYIGTCGVFLDPPYSHDLRERCYSEDHDISADVRAWAITNGDNPDFRIALCGYEGEHVMPDTWECVPWKAHGGYSRSERGVANRERERIWFSPHCLKGELPLFAEAVS